MRWPYHVINMLNLLKPSMLVIKLISNLQIPINALAFGSGINWNFRIANQLSNLTLGINYCLIFTNNWNDLTYCKPFSIGRVLNQEQYLVKDCCLRGDDVMLVLLSLVTLPHLH